MDNGLQHVLIFSQVICPELAKFQSGGLVHDFSYNKAAV
jgi:hypothetical protein